VAGLTATLGSVLSCLIMWAVALGLFVGAVFLIKYLNKKKGYNKEETVDVNA
jgi:O-antigen/teichoic acid export membrane protein